MNRKETVRDMKNIFVRPDAKGRIKLDEFIQGVSSFKVTLEEGKIILEPYSEIPFKDKWLFEDREILEKMKQLYLSDKKVEAT